MRRLFFALAAPTLPSPLEARIEALVRELGARPSALASRHITLAFLGDVEEARVADVLRAGQAAAQRARRSEYALDRLGGFPVGVARIPALSGWAPPELASLAAELGRELLARDFTVDRKPFRLHVTVARLRTPRAVPPHDIDKLHGPAEEIRLYESELLSAGAHYTVLETWRAGDGLRA